MQATWGSEIWVGEEREVLQKHFEVGVETVVADL